MTKSIILERGKPYPFKYPAHDASVADFLRSGGNRLLIRLDGMNSREENSFRNGLITGNFLYQDGALLWLFKFYDNKGAALFTFDSPFDARLIPSDEIQLHNIDNAEQRLLVDLHAVDDKGILRAIRAVTLPPKLTVDFLSAVQDQLSVTTGEKQMAVWMNQYPEQLAQHVKMETLGK